MEIIQQGTAPQDKKYRGTCTNCKPNTIIEFKQSEARFGEDFQSGGYLTIKCPVCKNDIYVNAGNIIAY